MASLSLRQRQKASLEKMLHLNRDELVEGSNGHGANSSVNSANDDLVWKVLVLDKRSQAIVLSILRVNDLLKLGVTVHSVISQHRLPLPDVPAVYFVEPSAENVRLILDDLAADKYESIYVNFTQSIGRELLEEFAKKVALSGKASKVLQVFDQYLDFVVTEPNLFSLDLGGSVYQKFLSPLTAEDEIHKLADHIANGLLSIIITQGSIPIVRCARGGPAELVATQLDLKLRDYVNNSKSFGDSFSSSQLLQQRPVFLLLDRLLDLSLMFSHSWIYQCMVADVLLLKRNTITFQKPANNNQSEQIVTKQYDVDPLDFFWAKNAALPFPDVVENADAELNTYKRDAQELSAKTGILSLTDIDPNAPDVDTQHIQQAVDALPELTARKATLDMHMDVLATLLKELESKQLDKFFEIEQNYNDPKTQQQFLLILKEEAKKDNVKDKIRTFIILNLVTDLPESFQKECEKILKEHAPTEDFAALKYIRKFKEVSKLSRIALSEGSGSSGNSVSQTQSNNTGALLNGLSLKLLGLTEGRLTDGLSSLASGLKNLLPDKKQLPITNVVEALMDPQNAQPNLIQLTDDYLYMDPKLRGGHSKQPQRQSYEEATVFVIGGGNYLEYLNLQEWSPTRGKRVIYGSTAIVTAVEFLDICGNLGRFEK